MKKEKIVTVSIVIDILGIWIAEIIGNTVVRAWHGPNQVDRRRCNLTEKQQSQLLRLVSSHPKHVAQDTCQWEGQHASVYIRREERWVIRHADGRVYQTHPGYQYSFARKKEMELRQHEQEMRVK